MLSTLNWLESVDTCIFVKMRVKLSGVMCLLLPDPQTELRSFQAYVKHIYPLNHTSNILPPTNKEKIRSHNVAAVVLKLICVNQAGFQFPENTSLSPNYWD